MAMTNRVSRGVCFIDTGLVPWLLLLSFSLSWDQVSKQQVGFLLKIPDATLVDRQRAYVPSFLQTNPESSSMDDPHALCLYLFLHVSKPDPTNKNGDDDVFPHFAFSHHLLPSTNCCSHILFASFHSFKNRKQNFEALPFLLLLLVVEAGMQLSLLLLLLLQHSHSLSTLPVVDIKSLQTKVQESSSDVGATCHRYLLWCVSHPTLLLQHSSFLRTIELSEAEMFNVT
jgi:hypothetical protein